MHSISFASRAYVVHLVEWLSRAPSDSRFASSIARSFGTVKAWLIRSQHQYLARPMTPMIGLWRQACHHEAEQKAAPGAENTGDGF
jgi:hypothetical protein